MPFGVYFGEKITDVGCERPESVADAREVEGERQGDGFVEHVLRVAKRVWVNRALAQAIGRNARTEDVWVYADKSSLEF